MSLLEHLAPVQAKLSSVIVTTPQAVALADVMKCISFTRTVSLPVLGLIENMSGYVCPCCGEVSYVFSTGGGEALAQRESLTFLGRLPVDPTLVTLLDAAEKPDTSATVATNGDAPDAEAAATFPLLEQYQATETWSLFKGIVEKILSQTAGTGAVATPSS